MGPSASACSVWVQIVRAQLAPPAPLVPPLSLPSLPLGLFVAAEAPSYVSFGISPPCWSGVGACMVFAPLYPPTKEPGKCS